jgi:hypothetical protein
VWLLLRDDSRKVSRRRDFRRRNDIEFGGLNQAFLVVPSLAILCDLASWRENGLAENRRFTRGRKA